MKTYIYLFAFCLSTTLFVQCGNSSESPQSSNGEEASAANPDIDLSETEAYYVLAASGLRMRTGASLDSEKMNVVEYGEKVQVVTNDDSAPIVVNGIKGRMLKAIYKNETGYMFEGYMSSIPVPDKNQMIADYARQLKRKGYEATYKESATDDEMELEEVLTLPTKNLQETFLIGQRLNIFEADFDLPTTDTPKSLTARVKGKTLTLKLENPNTIGKVDNVGSTDGAANYVEGYIFDMSNDNEAGYWMQNIDLKFDSKALNVVSVSAAYEGGSWTCELEKSGSFYTFTKYSVAD